MTLGTFREEMDRKRCHFSITRVFQCNRRTYDPCAATMLMEDVASGHHVPSTSSSRPFFFEEGVRQWG